MAEQGGAFGEDDSALYALFCRTLPPGDAAEACAAVASLDLPAASIDERRRIARQALLSALAGVAKGRKPR
jgi:hypothetical protein